MAKRRTPTPSPVPATGSLASPRPAQPPASQQSPRPPRPPLSTMIFWTLLLLTLHFSSLAAPWAIYSWTAPPYALAVALLLAVVWVWAAHRFQPAGFKLASFALGILLNVAGVLISWSLHLL